MRGPIASPPPWRSGFLTSKSRVGTARGASPGDGDGLNRRCPAARMTEAAQERSGPGTGTQVGAKNPSHPAGGLKPSPIPVIADEIVAGAEDLAPRQERQSAAVDWHWRGIDRLG